MQAEANVINQNAIGMPAMREAQTISVRQRMLNAAKRHLAPIALMTAVALTVPLASPDEAEAKRSHPVFPLRDYDQGDYGGRFPSQGCGPTSGAMIVATLKNNPRITPPVIGRQLPDKYWPSGMYASGFHYIAKKHGIHSEESTLQEAKDVLWDGGLAAVHARPGHFTSAGHYMVLKAVNSAGKFRIADPNGAPGRDSERRWWSIRELKRAGVDDVWTFLPSENMLMHTENMAGRLATGDIQVQAPQDSHEFDLPR